MLEIKYNSKHYEVKDLKIRENQCNFSQNIGFQRALKQNMETQTNEKLGILAKKLPKNWLAR